MKSNKLIAIGLAAAMVCSGFSGMTVCAGEMPEAVQQELQDTESIDSTGKSSEGFRYYKNMEEDTISISGYCGSNTEITIPSELDGKKVTRIGSWAFEDNNNLTGVTIADGITEIGVRAFAGCSNLSSVTIPASVSNIEGVAFSECEKLHTIKVDSRNSNYIVQDDILYSFDKTTLLWCSASKEGDLTIEEGVTDIAGSAFSCCSNLESVTLSGSVINNVSFYGNQLKNIFVDDSNTAYISLDGALYNADQTKLICCPARKEGDFVVAEGVMSIEKYAFADCSNLSSITIPEGVTEIGWDAFSGCSNLSSITIPEGVTNIAGETFLDCSSLSSITIPEGITEIGVRAFSGCSSLNSIVIPASVTEIIDASGTFFGCNQLQEIVVANGNTNYTSKEGILYNADQSRLLYCLSGKEGAVIIPESVTEIEAYAFEDCTLLSSITIPKSVTSIGWSAFGECQALEEIIVDSENTSYVVKDGILYNADQTELIRCPAGKTGDIELPKGVVKIADSAFRVCSKINHVTMPEGLESIGWGAFYDCSSLNDLSIPESVTYIDMYAFRNCSSIKNVTIPKGVTQIGDEAFSGCSSLTSVTIPSARCYVEEGAFADCSDDLILNVISGSRAEEYVIDYGIKYNSIQGKYEDCYSYTFLYTLGEKEFVAITDYFGTDTDLVIPSEIDGKEVDHIYQYSFENCNNITSVKTSVTVGAACLFWNCSNLSVLDLTGCTSSIGRSAFYNCTSLKTLIIPNIRGIETGAFSKCTSLEQVTIPSSAKSIGSNVFSGCSSLKDVTIPSSVTQIGSGSFKDCSSELVLHVTAGSAAEAFAKENNIKFQIMEDSGENQNPVCTHLWTSIVTPAKVGVNGSIQTKCTKCGTIQSTAALYAPASITLSQTEYTYNGKEQKPAVTVKDSNQKVLMNQTDYTVSYPEGMKNVGKYTVKVQFKGNYSGTMEQEFTIVPKSTKITKITAKKKGFSIKWKKQASQTSGYEISYSTDSKFKKGVSKPIDIKKVKTLTKTINKLKPKKKYYVRIRTYQKVNGGKIHSEWSKMKSVKTKK